METPKTEAGRTTERIMEEVRKRLPNLDTNTYNRVWESCHKVLQGLSDDELSDAIMDAKEKVRDDAERAMGFRSTGRGTVATNRPGGSKRRKNA